MPVSHLPHSSLFPLLPSQITQYLKRHTYFNGQQRRASPFPGGVPTTFRVPLSPLSYHRHELPPRKRFRLPPEPLIMLLLMMHTSPSITSLASQHPKNHTCSIQIGPSLFRSPPPGSGFALRNWSSCGHPPTSPFRTSFAHPNSSLAYPLAFVTFHISSMKIQRQKSYC